VLAALDEYAPEDRGKIYVLLETAVNEDMRRQFAAKRVKYEKEEACIRLLQGLNRSGDSGDTSS